MLLSIIRSLDDAVNETPMELFPSISYLYHNNFTSERVLITLMQLFVDFLHLSPYFYTKMVKYSIVRR